MKAQRRHELKQNSLIHALQNLPETGKLYGSQIALGVIVVALVIIWVRYRSTSATERVTAAEQSLDGASDSLKRLKMALQIQRGDEPAVAAERRQMYMQGIAMVDDALERVGDRDAQVKAQALLLRGDLNFAMANLPSLAGAATQPSLRPEQPIEDLLNSAADAYGEVLQEFPSDDFAATSAHFGLAAVAEDRAGASGDPQQWESARLQYQAIVDGGGTPAFRNLAMERLQSLAKVQQPLTVDLGLRPATQPSAAPTTMPALMPLSLSPTTNPAPAAPTR
jgi:hypothetical protein